MRYRLDVNNGAHEFDAPSGITLLAALRDDLQLTGSRYGCGHGACGACYVLVDGEPHPACMLTAGEVVDKRVVTVEGLAAGEDLHPVQRAFVDHDALQCGYCTSGMILSAVALLSRLPSPSDDEIRQALAAHLCRCGVYGRAVSAVKDAIRRPTRCRGTWAPSAACPRQSTANGCAPPRRTRARCFSSARPPGSSAQPAN